MNSDVLAGSGRESTLRIGVLYPDVLGTYGDSGNAVVLRERARMRGIAAEIVNIGLDDAIATEVDMYTLGGGEDSAQAMALNGLRTDPGLHRFVEAGSPVLAICASLQLLGHWYEDASGTRHEGAGLLDVVTVPQGRRSIGELRVASLLEGLTETLTGFENHGGGTFLGADAAPLGRVLHGSGNATVECPADFAAAYDEPIDGAVQGSIIATYMHGPVLARNPELADELLARAMGVSRGDLTPLEIPEVTQLRATLLTTSEN